MGQKERSSHEPRGGLIPALAISLYCKYVFNSAVGCRQVQKAMPKNLLAMAVGIKQKQVVDAIVQKVTDPPAKNGQISPEIMPILLPSETIRDFLFFFFARYYRISTWSPSRVAR